MTTSREGDCPHPHPRVPFSGDGSILDLGSAGGCYELRKRLGRGGMAEIYLARRLGTEGFARDVAVKRIISERQHDEVYRRMFLDEARLVSRLTHRNIAQVFDFQYQERDNAFYLVMEYIDGQSLRDLMSLSQRIGRPLPQGFALYVAAELAAALHHAHSATDDNGRALGIVHRDITPHNVMLTAEGDVKLLDFGIALSSIAGRERTASGIIKGKAAYMSPEQALGDGSLDGRSDLFSLGILLFEMLTGTNLFDAGTETRTLLCITQADPAHLRKALKTLSPRVRNILEKALARNREDRYPTVDTFRTAIRGYMHSTGILYGPEEAAATLGRLMKVSAAAKLFVTPSAPPFSSAAPEAEHTKPIAEVSPSNRRGRRALALLGVAVASALGFLLLTLPQQPSAEQPVKERLSAMPASTALPTTEVAEPVDMTPKPSPTPSPRTTLPRQPAPLLMLTHPPPPPVEATAVPRRKLLRNMAMELADTPP
jgi:serine/threonine protein kinase